MKLLLFKAAFLVAICSACTGSKQEQNGSPGSPEIPGSAGIEIAENKYRSFIESRSGYDSVPRTYEDGKLVLKVGRDWTRGFFPGSLWYLYEITGEEYWKEKAMNYTLALEDIASYTHTHDLGFMLYCSAGNGYRITGDKKLYDILIRGANSLMTRYDPNIRAIKSWDWGAREGWSYPVIVDNMMNLEYLFWATRVTGDSAYYQVAVNHANTTLENHFREDFSSYHVVDYDTSAFGPRWKGTHQGFSDASAWARGQAWGLYGYTVMYRETLDKRYLNLAERIASFILNHPNLPEDLIPYYDYDDPAMPDIPRDASAASITASALLELDKYLPDENYYEAAEKILTTLSSEAYLSSNDNHPFILEHSTGNKPSDSEVDVPLNYADYYYLESIYRFQKQQKPALLWHSNKFTELFFRQDRIISMAEEKMDQGPYSVLQKSFDPPSGDKHDYLSMGIYWWPNPDTETGLPYIRRDGEVNPEVRNITDKAYLSTTIDNALVEGLAYYYTGQKQYAQKTASLLKSWFINDSTRMNPHLQYGQGVPGRSEGRCYGIIETRDISQVLDAAHLIKNSDAWTPDDQQSLETWMADYLHWLLTSELGVQECATTNNHGTWYDVQSASIALGIGKYEVARDILLRSKGRILDHVDSTGVQPEEVSRTRSWDYSIMNLQSMMILAQLGEEVGFNYWHIPHGGKPAIQSALDFLLPYALDPVNWPYQQIQEFEPDKIASLLKTAILKYPEEAGKYQEALQKLESQANDLGFYL